jgi:indole-3-glycerol phosphate synthase
MNILETITQRKREELAGAKTKMTVEQLMQTAFFSRKTFSLKEYLLDETKTGIIAEFKRQSPSKGIINDRSDVLTVTKSYTAHGASCLSVLTDKEFFGGRKSDLVAARVNDIPILRKDFIIDEYQLVEAKAIGADVILLIAACLTPGRTKELASFARQLQLEVLLEIHNEEELGHICDETELVGINNRDLKTFSVDINRSKELAAKIPPGKILIAESGISDVKTIKELREHQFRGFLIGENFMKEKEPGEAFRVFVERLKS